MFFRTAWRPSVAWSLLPRSRILRQYLQAQTGAIGPRCASILTSCVELWICSPENTLTSAVPSGAGPSLVPCFFKVVFLLAGFATFRALQGFSSLGNFRDQKLDRSDRLPKLADGDSLGRVLGVVFTTRTNLNKLKQQIVVLLVVVVVVVVVVLFDLFVEQSWLRQIHRPVGVELSGFGF